MHFFLYIVERFLQPMMPSSDPVENSSSAPSNEAPGGPPTTITTKQEAS